MSPQHILAEWNACRQWLVPALVDITEDDLLNEMLLNRAQLWRGDAGAIVTQLLAEPEPHVCLWIAGGEKTDVLSLGAGIAAWARAQGAAAARVCGRQGWARALKAYGFEPDGEQLRKAL